MIKLGSTIKRFRTAANMTQVELASKLDIESTFLSAVENNKRLPSFTLLKRICRALHLPAEVMFWESVEIDPSISRKDQEIIHLAKSILKQYYKCA